MAGSVCLGSSIKVRAPFFHEIPAPFHFADLSSGFLPLPNLPVTYSLRKHLRAFIDLLSSAFED